MKAIIAINNKGCIGLNGELPWRSKSDLEHFKKLTMNCTLLVGHNTSVKLPKLPGRTLVIDSKDKLYTNVDWCIGGKKTYEKYMQLFTEIHISHINDDTEGDVMAPDFSSVNESCKIFNYYFENADQEK